jgi:hypothetical protein
MVIDFTEIIDDHAFENFCKHLLQDLRLNIPVQPAIGPDGGRDIICEEPSRFGSTGYRWLVSCKHYARSGRSVGINSDAAIANKLIEHGCNGFMFFFSTGYTESFRTSVDKVCEHIRSQSKIFNCYDIEKILLSSPKFYPRIRQYFPTSHDRLVRLISEDECCPYCSPQNALYAVYTKNTSNNEISYQVLCENCVDELREHLQESKVEYGISQIRSAAQW